MVSTRRTARTEPVEEVIAEPAGTALRKKPLRRATAKKPEPEAQPKSTRSRKAVPEPDTTTAPEPADGVQSVPQKQTRRAGGRTKAVAAEIHKDDVVEEPVKPVRVTAGRATAATKATAARATATRSKKTEALVKPAQQAPAVSEPEQTRRTRTAAPKAQPLSPKKIKQVVRPRLRSTKTTDAKAIATKTAPPTRKITRKRTVSDENAEVPELTHDVLGTQQDVVILDSTSVKRASPVHLPAHESAIESEASMSSRATTPSASPAPSFDHMQDENEYHHREEQASIEDASDDDDGDLDADNDVSEDELCGPKTPMKRADPGPEAHYLASVQRTIRRAEQDSLARSPGIQYSPALQRRMGTPQTQKEYRKTELVSSGIRPMTVGRASNRSFVFGDLKAATRPLATEDEDTASEDQGSDTGSSLLDTQVESPVAQTSEANQSQPLPLPQDEDESFVMDGGEQDSVRLVLVEDEEVDPDETVLVHQTEPDDDSSPALHPGSSFESEDTVLITRDVAIGTCGDDEDEEDDGNESTGRTSCTPETMIWANIRQDVTIPINFDAHLAGMRLPPLTETPDRPSLPLTTMEVSQATVEPLESVARTEAKNGSYQYELDTAQPHEDAEEEPELPAQDATVNLNDFIDMGALAEPTLALELPAQLPGPAQEVGGTSGEENRSRSSGLDEWDVPKGRSEQADAVAANEHESQDMPHYALPTLAFDARRKSLPAFSARTPVKAGTRPNTSDGASMPRFAAPFAEPWWNRSRSKSEVTTPHASPIRPRPGSSRRLTVAPHADPPAQTTPLTDSTDALCSTPSERYPKLTARHLAKTAAPPSRFRTPTQVPTKRPVTVSKPAATAITPRASTLRPRQRLPAVEHEHDPSTPAPQSATPSRTATLPVETPSERYPRLGTRKDYEEHANTVAAPARFRTPGQKTPLKRPATTQKPAPGSLRKIALKNSTPMASHTPVKTPLKAAAMTSAQVPMTPHPAAPLKGVVAMVEVYTLEGSYASAPFIALLHRLGAKTTKVWSERVSHVIFKDGSPTTLQRVRLHNKGVDEAGDGRYVHCVNSRWVSDCDAEGLRVDERDEVYAVDVSEIPRGGQRRRKSMEPSALVNLGGNIIRDRKSSLGRSSLARSQLKLDSPAEEVEVTVVETPKGREHDKENDEDEPSSPATPAYLAAPDQLVQQTAPQNRVRKLRLSAQEEARNRRLTFFPVAGA